jgi:5-formyltetrahydrofolate cyclo-ligase
MPTRPATADRNTLRKQLRLQRRQLPPGERVTCAKQLTQHLGRERILLNSRHIAVYLPADGEMDTWPLIEFLWSLGKTTYLPVLVPFSEQRLWFSTYTRDDALVYNRFGILEPERVHYGRIRTAALDLVLTPLVAFDTSGHRLGMGGGYYDRSFRFLKQRRYLCKPRLLGLAYEFQRIPRISPESWDVPLDAVATEDRVYHCTR